MAGNGAALAAEISKEGGGRATPAHSNLFVGNIAATVTEDELKNAFAPFGAIESVLLTSKAGRPSGFVKMVNVDEAGNAVTALNGSQGWVVKYANYDVGEAPKFNRKGGGFGAYGGFGGGYGGWWPQPKGYGKGFGKFGGWNFQGGKGYGFPKGFGKGAVPELREDGPERPEPPPSDNLYVKHLPLGITEEDLQTTFLPCGEIAELRILRPDFALECAALVRFATEEAATQARTTLDDTVVQGSTPPLYANAQMSKGTAKQDHVYLKNVPANTSEDKIKAVLERHGEVKWFKIMRANAGQSRIGATCAALFEMSSEAEATAAIEALNDTALSLSYVAPAMKVRYAANKAAAKAAAESGEGAEAEAAAEPATETAPQIPEMPATRLAGDFAPPS